MKNLCVTSFLAVCLAGTSLPPPAPVKETNAVSLARIGNAFFFNTHNDSNQKTNGASKMVPGKKYLQRHPQCFLLADELEGCFAFACAAGIGSIVTPLA